MGEAPRLGERRLHYVVCGSRLPLPLEGLETVLKFYPLKWKLSCTCSAVVRYILRYHDHTQSLIPKNFIEEWLYGKRSYRTKEQSLRIQEGIQRTLEVGVASF